jgi:hypothetical protein
MAPDTVLNLEKIMDHCHEKWREADQVPASGWPTPDIQTGKKMAYNDVLQFVRTLIAEAR